MPARLWCKKNGRTLYRMSRESLNSLAKELPPHMDLILLSNAHALRRALSYFLRFCVYLWTDRNDSNTLHVDAIFLKNAVFTNIPIRVDFLSYKDTLRVKE